MIRGGFRAPRRFKLIHELTTRYSKRFFVKIEQLSIQGDHIHFVLRISRRSSFQNFLRVLAGQISQRQVTDTPLKKGKLWQHRPFTRVVQGLKAYLTVRNYVQLNEQEAVGIIPYRKERLRGLSAEEMEWLWT